jgi:hypothetical protein
METLDKHFRTLTQAVFKKHGFAQGDVTAHWPQIVGDTLAHLCVPERIRWPRGEDKQGGTLFLKAQAGRALDVQYASAAIIEKVNQFLGYQAIATIKVSAAHSIAAPAEKPIATAPTPEILAQIEPVADPVLKSALARLGAGVTAENARSPQPK